MRIFSSPSLMLMKLRVWSGSDFKEEQNSSRGFTAVMSRPASIRVGEVKRRRREHEKGGQMRQKWGMMGITDLPFPDLRLVKQGTEDCGASKIFDYLPITDSLHHCCAWKSRLISRLIGQSYVTSRVTYLNIETNQKWQTEISLSASANLTKPGAEWWNHSCHHASSRAFESPYVEFHCYHCHGFHLHTADSRYIVDQIT